VFSSCFWHVASMSATVRISVEDAHAPSSLLIPRSRLSGRPREPACPPRQKTPPREKAGFLVRAACPEGLGSVAGRPVGWRLGRDRLPAGAEISGERSAPAGMGKRVGEVLREGLGTVIPGLPRGPSEGAGALRWIPDRRCFAACPG
jgi:hypothetical protein